MGAWTLTAASIVWFLGATLAAAYAAEEALAPFSWTGWQTVALVTAALFGAGAVLLTIRRSEQAAEPARRFSPAALRAGGALVILGLFLGAVFLPAIALSAVGAVIVLVETPRAAKLVQPGRSARSGPADHR